MIGAMSVDVALALLVGVAISARAAGAQVSLEVMNPRGDIPPPQTTGISARVSSLDGKKIVLIDNGKFGADNFLEVVGKMLKDRYPTATIVMYPKTAAQTITNLPKWYPTVKQQGDLFVFGVGD
jgi:hypothetical protein